ncbi:hypothetical protein QVD17_11548 [Tagetes erecta]|uniref:Uncharacterized protein n=1 Tax=Tagetes erecta TaxID=13708 RepID=A0AAD8L0X0_TARER|nr:hypothetical protein QVD17_11548 [Tagetes erecta]
MASMCLSCLVLHYKNSHDNINRKFGIFKPICSLKSTSKAVTTKVVVADETISRRSANYAPSLWSFDDIQSLSSEYAREDYKARVDTLKDAVKLMMIREMGNPLSTLELVDDLQRLGISYHFENEIRNILEVIYNTYYKTYDKWNKIDLNLKALGFRLLRQHGYQVPQEIFHNFKDKTRLESHSDEDTMAMLNLYEASYLSFEDESILGNARDFATKYLKKNQEKMDESALISSLVSHALELPLHQRVPRVEAKWFIKVYEKRSDMNHTLLELAILDFNIVQAIHVQDLKHTSRWDINAIEELPNYMKICFIGFYNTINEISYNTLADTGIFILPYLKNVWADLCKAYLVEARWYYNGYAPTLQEYLDNAAVSISGPTILMHAMFLTSIGATQEILQCMERFEKIVHYSSLILRLANDLGTSTDELTRGDVWKSIECYMHETSATEGEARRYIKELINDTWKKLNKERATCANSQFSREFIEYATNLARMAQFVYAEGDGHGRPDLIKFHVSSLLFNPI